MALIQVFYGDHNQNTEPEITCNIWYNISRSQNNL